MKDITCRDCGVVFKSLKLSRRRCDACKRAKKREDSKREKREAWQDPVKREHQKQIKKEHYCRKPQSWMLTSARKRAVEKGIEFNLKASDIALPEGMLCPILGMKMESNYGKDGGNKPNSPSLDRVDINRGYVPGNVCIISLKANRMKQNCSLEDLYKLVAYVERHVNKEGVN